MIALENRGVPVKLGDPWIRVGPVVAEGAVRSVWNGARMLRSDRTADGKRTVRARNDDTQTIKQERHQTGDGDE